MIVSAVHHSATMNIYVIRLIYNLLIILVIPNLKVESLRQVYCIENRTNTAARNAVLLSDVAEQR